MLIHRVIIKLEIHLRIQHVYDIRLKIFKPLYIM